MGWKAWWRLHKNAVSNIGQVLEAAPDKAAAVRPPTMKTIRVKRTRQAGHCWRSGDKLISNILLWTPSHRQAKTGQPTRTYIQQFCSDTVCSLEDLPRAMGERGSGWSMLAARHYDDVLQMSTNLIKENGFMLKNKKKSKKQTISDRNYNRHGLCWSCTSCKYTCPRWSPTA